MSCSLQIDLASSRYENHDHSYLLDYKCFLSLSLPRNTVPFSWPVNFISPHDHS